MNQGFPLNAAPRTSQVPAPSRSIVDSDLPGAEHPELAREFDAFAGMGGSQITRAIGTRPRFYYDMVDVFDQQGMPPKRTAFLHVQISVVGDQTTRKTRPITEDLARRLYPREWAHFSQTRQHQKTGTDLADVPGVTQNMVAQANINNVFTVEELLALSPDRIAGLGREVHQLAKRAELWKERADGAKDETSIADRLAAMEAALANATAMAEKHRADNQSLQAALSILKQTGAGRPAPAAGDVLTMASPDDDQDFSDVVDGFTAGSGDGEEGERSPLDD